MDAIDLLNDKINPRNGNENYHYGQRRPVTFPRLINGLRQKEGAQIVRDRTDGIQTDQPQRRQQDINLLPLRQRHLQTSVDAEISNVQKSRRQNTQRQQGKSGTQHTPFLPGRARIISRRFACYIFSHFQFLRLLPVPYFTRCDRFCHLPQDGFFQFQPKKKLPCRT